jgi:5-methylcytosine-specific restriction protein A
VAYFIDPFDEKTWEEARTRGDFKVSGHPRRVANQDKIQEGDIFLCYLLKRKEFVGALEVVGPYEEVGEEGPRIWKRDLFPIRFPVRLLSRVAIGDGVTREEVEAISSRPNSWRGGGIAQNSLNSILDEEGDWILEQLLERDQLSADDPETDHLREDLLAIASGISEARSETYSEHPLAKLIRGRWAEDLKRSAWSDMYLTQGSAGSGNWAEVVWAAIFNRLVTDTATRGYYLTYLISPTGDQILLTLMLGTTEILDKYKQGGYEEVLRSNAARDLELLSNEDTSDLLTGPVSNGGSGTLARGYEAGTIAAIRYQGEDLPSFGVLRSDLDRMLKLYLSLFDAKAELQTGIDADGPTVGTRQGASQKEKEAVRRERRRLVTHRRAERNQALSRDAKKARGNICEVPACGKDSRAIYGDLLKDDRSLVEAHHIVPFSQLDNNVELDPEKDFRVVCPDCHRAIHQRRPEPFTLEEVSAAIEKANANQS